MNAVKNISHRVYKNYFEKGYSTNRISLFDASIWPFVIGVIFAFFTIGISGKLAAYIFLIGIGGFVLSILTHVILFVAGSFYSRGVLTSMKLALEFIAIGIALFVVGAIGLYGGIFISAGIFLYALPFDTIFLPFNIIGFAVCSIWWYSKGLLLLEEGKPPEKAFAAEIRFYKNIRSRFTNR
jgi:hypothetical protein